MAESIRGTLYFNWTLRHVCQPKVFREPGCPNDTWHYGVNAESIEGGGHIGQAACKWSLHYRTPNNQQTSHSFTMPFELKSSRTNQQPLFTCKVSFQLPISILTSASNPVYLLDDIRSMIDRQAVGPMCPPPLPEGGGSDRSPPMALHSFLFPCLADRIAQPSSPTSLYKPRWPESLDRF